MNNKSLFWYGFRARLVKGFGIVLIFAGLFLIAFNWMVALILMIVGIVLIAKGSSSEYDYKRQGGYIVYND